MENIHKLDNDMVESLKNMLNADSNDSVKIALSILNNVDYNDSKSVEYIHNVLNYCSGLHFALFQNKKGDIRTRFNYVYFNSYSHRPSIIDDDSSLDDDHEWTPYEPHNDLNK